MAELVRNTNRRTASAARIEEGAGLSRRDQSSGLRRNALRYSALRAANVAAEMLGYARNRHPVESEGARAAANPTYRLRSPIVSARSSSARVAKARMLACRSALSVRKVK